MVSDKVTAPTSPTLKQKYPLDQQTTTTTTATTGQKHPTFNDAALRVAVWVCILIYATVGVLIGVVFVSALPFPVQMVAALSYLVIGLLGWLPWQVGRNHESD